MALSYSASVAGVRWARPFFFDDPLLLILLFAIGPAALILILGALRRPLGMLVALLQPVFWLYIVSRPEDPAWLWAIPFSCGGLIIVAGRLAQDRSLPRAVTFAALALALALTVALSPGRPSGNPRVLLVAVEGITWESAAELIGAGRLPHLARQAFGNRMAPLRLPPPLEPHQVWCTLASGVLPAEGDARDRVRAQDCRSGRIWDESQRAGLAIGISGWPGPPPPHPQLGPAEFVLPEPRRPEDWLDALASGARLSTLRFLAEDRIELLRRRRTACGEDIPRERLLWALQADACSEMMRARQPDFASALFRLGDDGYARDDRAAHVSGALGEAFDRALGKLIRATPSQAAWVVVAVPGHSRAGDAGEGHPDGLCLIAGPVAGAVAGAAPQADVASVVSVAPTLAAWLGLPPPPWRSPDYTGIQ